MGRKSIVKESGLISDYPYSEMGDPNSDTKQNSSDVFCKFTACKETLSRYCISKRCLLEHKSLYSNFYSLVYKSDN